MISSDFCTKPIVQTHFLELRREERQSVIGFAMSSQLTHLLEARKGKEQSVMSFIQIVLRSLSGGKEEANCQQ